MQSFKRLKDVPCSQKYIKPIRSGTDGYVTCGAVTVFSPGFERSSERKAVQKLTQDAFIRTRSPLRNTFTDKSVSRLLKGVAKHHADDQFIQSEQFCTFDQCSTDILLHSNSKKYSIPKAVSKSAKDKFKELALKNSRAETSKRINARTNRLPNSLQSDEKRNLEGHVIKEEKMEDSQIIQESSSPSPARDSKKISSNQKSSRFTRSNTYNAYRKTLNSGSGKPCDTMSTQPGSVGFARPNSSSGRAKIFPPPNTHVAQYFSRDRPQTAKMPRMVHPSMNDRSLGKLLVNTNSVPHMENEEAILMDRAQSLKEIRGMMNKRSFLRKNHSGIPRPITSAKNQQRNRLSQDGGQYTTTSGHLKVPGMECDPSVTQSSMYQSNQQLNGQFYPSQTQQLTPQDKRTPSFVTRKADGLNVARSVSPLLPNPVDMATHAINERNVQSAFNYRQQSAKNLRSCSSKNNFSTAPVPLIVQQRRQQNQQPLQNKKTKENNKKILCHAIAKSFGILHAYGEYDRFMKLSKSFLKQKGLIQNQAPKRKRMKNRDNSQLKFKNKNSTQNVISPIQLTRGTKQNISQPIESPRNYENILPENRSSLSAQQPTYQSNETTTKNRVSSSKRSSLNYEQQETNNFINKVQQQKQAQEGRENVETYIQLMKDDKANAERQNNSSGGKDVLNTFKQASNISRESYADQYKNQIVQHARHEHARAANYFAVESLEDTVKNVLIVNKDASPTLGYSPQRQNQKSYDYDDEDVNELVDQDEEESEEFQEKVTLDKQNDKDFNNITETTDGMNYEDLKKVTEEADSSHHASQHLLKKQKNKHSIDQDVSQELEIDPHFHMKKQTTQAPLIVQNEVDTKIL